MSVMQPLPGLSGIRFFEPLNAEQLAQVARQYRFKPVRLVKGETLASSDAPLEYVFFVLQGTLRAHIAGPGGSSITVALFGRQDVTNLVAALNRDDTARYGLSATRPSQVLAMPCRDFLAMMNTYPALSQSLVQDFSDFINRCFDAIQLSNYKLVRSKIAYHLIVEAKRHDTEAPYIGSVELLSQLLNVARPTLSKELNQLQREGLISVERTHIRLLRKHVLHEYT